MATDGNHIGNDPVPNEGVLTPPTIDQIADMYAEYVRWADQGALSGAAPPSGGPTPSCHLSGHPLDDAPSHRIALIRCRPVVYSIRPGSWYHLTFSPHNSSYDRIQYWYHDKGLDYLRRKYIGDHFMISREVNATKCHFHMLIRTLHAFPTDSNNPRFHIRAQPVTPGTEINVVEYLLKEGFDRTIVQYVDYYVTPI